MAAVLVERSHRFGEQLPKPAGDRRLHDRRLRHFRCSQRLASEFRPVEARLRREGRQRGAVARFQNRAYSQPALSRVLCSGERGTSGCRAHGSRLDVERCFRYFLAVLTIVAGGGDIARSYG